MRSFSFCTKTVSCLHAQTETFRKVSPILWLDCKRSYPTLSANRLPVLRQLSVGVCAQNNYSLPSDLQDWASGQNSWLSPIAWCSFDEVDSTRHSTRPW